MKNILVFYGGKSCEHDVSVITGVMALNALRGSDYNPVPVYVTREGEWYSGDKLFDMSFYNKFETGKLKKVTLLPSEPQLYAVKKEKLRKYLVAAAAINCLHGFNGEDGSLAGLLQLSGVPLASPPTFASSLSMDKYYTKLILSGLDVAYLPFVRICRNNYNKGKQFAVEFVKKRLGFPVIVKPANLGSSIGITRVGEEKDLIRALDTAFRYDGKVIVESALEGFREINCACYKSGDRYFVSECEEPLNVGEMLTFEDKYRADSLKKFPADIEKGISDKIKDTVKYVYRKLDFRGVIRIDFLVKDGNVYLNEINSVPGSLAYYLFCDGSDKLAEFLSVLIEDALDDYAEFKSNDFGFRSDVLSFGGKMKA